MMPFLRVITWAALGVGALAYVWVLLVLVGGYAVVCWHDRHEA